MIFISSRHFLGTTSIEIGLKDFKLLAQSFLNTKYLNKFETIPSSDLFITKAKGKIDY